MSPALMSVIKPRAKVRRSAYGRVETRSANRTEPTPLSPRADPMNPEKLLKHITGFEK